MLSLCCKKIVWCLAFGVRRTPLLTPSSHSVPDVDYVEDSVIFLFPQRLWKKSSPTAVGPYAWVQGRRATSKVTATSGGRLTNRYAWVPGRPTRRACLGVNLPLRVPPCKHYPEEVTEFKMAALILLRYRQRRLLRRNRIFRDRTNPLHKFNDLELFWQFRFRRVDILQMTNELKEELEHLNRKGALPPVFTGRRTALNPCQQWTSIARRFPPPPPPLFFFFFF